MQQARRSFLYQCGIFAQIAIALTCGLLSLGLTSHPVSAAEEAAYVRVIHASPFVGTADVFVDGKSMLSSFEFGAVTDYVALPAGEHRIQIALVGKGIDASAVNQVLPVTGGEVYTIAALGTALDNLKLQTFVDNNQVAPDQSRIRIYHLAPDASTIDVTVDEATRVNGVTYPNTSDYMTVNTGSYTVKVTNPQDQALKQLTTELKANTITSIFTVGLFNGNPRIQIVSAHTAGTPDLPQTGSDPTPQGVLAPNMHPAWLLLFTGTIIIGIAAIVYLQRHQRRIR